MDPNAALDDLRYHAHAVPTINAPEDRAEAAEKMSESIIALDDWLTRGGFLPTPWLATLTAGREN